MNVKKKIEFEFEKAENTAVGIRHVDHVANTIQHIFAKRKHLEITLTKLYWLLGRKSRLSMSNKLLLYKVILKPISTYGIQLWGSASISNIEILERFQSKALRMIADAPRYVPNVILRQDLQIPSVKEEIRRFSIHYSSRLQTHPNSLAVHLMEPPEHRRLKRHQPTDLITQFQD
jgi:hypothetical protein